MMNCPVCESGARHIVHVRINHDHWAAAKKIAEDRDVKFAQALRLLLDRAVQAPEE